MKDQNSDKMCQQLGRCLNDGDKPNYMTVKKFCKTHNIEFKGIINQPVLDAIHKKLLEMGYK